MIFGKNHSYNSFAGNPRYTVNLLIDLHNKASYIYIE